MSAFVKAATDGQDNGPAIVHSTYQLATIELKVREDINYHIREYNGEPAVVLEDSFASRFYRIGIAEYSFLSLLDGKTTFATALGKTAGILREDALSEQHAAQFCQWLVQSGLATTQHSRSVARLEAQASSHRTRQRKSRFTAISQRVPLFHPDRLTQTLHDFLGWTVTPPALLVWLASLVCAAIAIGTNLEAFLHASPQIIAKENWIWAAAIYVMLRVIHESAHAVACKHFGGNVREAGVMFVLLVPLPYVDLSSAWRFGSKWERILTSAAGMMGELFIAAVAVAVWLNSPPGIVQQQAYNVIWIAGLSTLLFNANPLMRFDGYYILSDGLNLPNLATHGQQAIQAWTRRWLLGTPIPQAAFNRRPKTILAYGLAALVWRCLLTVAIAFALEKLLPAAGVLFIAGILVKNFARPIAGWLRGTAFREGRPCLGQIKRPVAIVGGLIALGIGLAYAPWIGRERTAVVVDYFPQGELRMAAGGFLEEWFVEPGQTVSANHLIARVRNEELVGKHSELTAELAISRQKIDLHIDAQYPAAAEVESEHLRSLEMRVAEVERQLAGLQVKSPWDGVVLSKNLTERMGTYLHQGDVVVALGGAGKLEMVALVNQSQYESFKQQAGKRVRVHIAGDATPWHDAMLVHLDSRATRRIPHVALTALAGGEHAVQQLPAQGQDSEEYELVEPCFVARISVDVQLAEQLRRGQLGFVSLASAEPTFGGYLKQRLNHWWDKKTAELQNAWYF